MRYAFLILPFLCMHAHAGLLLTIQRTGASVDNPLLRFEGTGGGVQSVTLRLGDAAFNFDSSEFVASSGGFLATLVSPDAVNAGIRSDELTYDFTGFGGPTWLSARVDIDRDLGSATVDWQQTLFNNGDLPNAVLETVWLDGSLSSVLLHDEPNRNPLSLYKVEIVPECSPLLLAGLASVLGFVFRYRR